MRSPSTWAGWATSEVMTTSHACHRSMRLPPRRLRVTTLAATPSQPNMPFGARLTTSSLPSSMVASGITRSRLPADNQVVPLVADPAAAELAARLGSTRSAAGVDLWADRLGGAVLAIGNAPTALFHLLDLVAAGGPRPAAVLGIPVGFIGAAESKTALAASDLEHLVVHGRRGGSAMAAAALNALATEVE